MLISIQNVIKKFQWLNSVTFKNFLTIDNATNLVFWCHFLNKLEPWYAVYIMQQ